MNSIATNHPRQIDFSFFTEGVPLWAIDARMKVMAMEYGEVIFRAWERVQPELDRFYAGRIRIHKLAGWFQMIIMAGLLTLGVLLIIPAGGNQSARLLAFFGLWVLAMTFQYLIAPYILRRDKARHCFLIEV